MWVRSIWFSIKSTRNNFLNIHHNFCFMVLTGSDTLSKLTGGKMGAIFISICCLLNYATIAQTVHVYWLANSVLDKVWKQAIAA
jgi:hypothetical protein